PAKAAAQAALETSIEAAEALTGLTEAEQAVVNTAIADAEAVLTKVDATVAELEAAKTALDAVVADPAKAAAKDALADAIELAGELEDLTAAEQASVNEAVEAAT